MKGFRVGISAMQYEPYPVLVRKWRHFEELGFESIWHCDHLLFTGDSTVPLYEGWTVLSALAAETSRIRLGVLVSSNVLRHPALLVQEAITVDHVSQGRVEVGVGCGWYEEEHERFGIPLFEPGPRVDRFEEAMEIIEPLLRGETVSYEGEHYQLSEAKLRPYPVQLPRPPLTLAAHQPRMIRICARYADRWNSSGTPAEMAERNRILDEACEKIGRDPGEIVRSMRVSVPKLVAGGFPNPWSSVDAFCEVAGAYREVGVEEFIIDQPRPEQYQTAERIASEVL